MAKPFDIQGARAAGYSDNEIANHLATESKFDIDNARKSGYSDQEIIKYLSEPRTTNDRIPVSKAERAFSGGQQQAPTAREPSLAERLLGTGEAGLTLGTAAVPGTLGLIGGTLGGLAGALTTGEFGTQEARRRIEQGAAESMGALTYEPRTAQGQQQAQAVGDVLNQLIPVVPLTSELAALGQGAQVVAPALTTGAARIAAPVAEVAQRLRTAATEGLGIQGAQETATSGRASIGAAATPLETARIEKAESLPVPVKLTQGAAKREADQLSFEKEQMKGPLGAPLRARAEENNIQALQNFDALIDKTEAQAPDLTMAGSSAVKALSEGYKAAKNKTRAAYAEAEKSPEALTEVDATPVIEHLNQTPSGLKTTALSDHAKQYAVRLGIAERADDGTLIPKKTDVKTMEAWRKEISQATGFEPVEVRDSTILKGLIDQQTEPVAGPLYQQARALRTQQARKYENRAIVARLISNRKGMDDPQVAVDQVFNKSIINGSPEEITFLKRVLQTSGEDGQQAWKELQGALVRHIKEESTKGMGIDSADNPIVSPAKLHQTVSALDKNGRLDIVLGKKNAEIVRDLNEVVRYVNTVPPGTLVNTSGTAGMLMAAMAEAGATGVLTGLPVPIISLLRSLVQQVRDRKIKMRIERALNNQRQR